MSNYRRLTVLLLVIGAALIVAWVLWARPQTIDLAASAPADSLAFLEADDPIRVLSAVAESKAWRSLAGPLDSSIPGVSRLAVWLARWFELGTADSLLLSRAQIAVVLTGAEVSQNRGNLTVRPLTTLIIETHSRRQVRQAVEGHVEDLAHRIYASPRFSRTNIDGEEIADWSAADGSGHIILGFVDSTAFIGNDETSVIKCIAAKRGKRASLSTESSFLDNRNKLQNATSLLFTFISRAGVKDLLQAYALTNSPSTDALNAARLMSETAGNLVSSLSCVSQLVDSMTEDRCFIGLSEGIANKLRPTMVPERPIEVVSLPFVPPDAYSLSVYNFHDIDGLWSDLNAVVASHADALSAVAAHALLRLLFKPYGIDDADAFVHAIGPRVMTVRLEDNASSVLITEPLDLQALRRLADARLGNAPRTETLGPYDLRVSNTDNWAVAFADEKLLMGQAELVRRCLETKLKAQSLASLEAFRQSQRRLDVSLHFSSVTFANDRQQAISFIEMFSKRDRPTFSNNAEVVEQAALSLPYAVRVTILKENGIEWTSRSAFGFAGSLFATILPGGAK